MKIRSALAVTFCFFIVSEVAVASVHPLTCQLLDSRNQPADHPYQIYASRGSKDYKINDNGAVVSISWVWFDNPVRISLLRNKHYPFSIPFDTKTIREQTFQHDDDGNINATFDLRDVEQGLKLHCETNL